MPLYNLVKVSTATTGTGTVTLGAAVSGFLTFAQGGVTDGATVSYGIVEGTNREVGTGVYSASAGTMTRATILNSTNSNGLITLAGAAQVYLTVTNEDIPGYASSVIYA